MSGWTRDQVLERLEEAVVTLRRLPMKSVQGYVTGWPDIVRTAQEVMAMEKEPIKIPPSAKVIQEMEETIYWLFHLDTEEERRLVWLRAEKVPWKKICRMFGIGRTTAHFRHRTALFKIALRLDGYLKREK